MLAHYCLIQFAISQFHCFIFELYSNISRRHFLPLSLVETGHALSLNKFKTQIFPQINHNCNQIENQTLFIKVYKICLSSNSPGYSEYNLICE
jgi:hypothetical protein